MDINNFTSLPASILDDLYEEPELQTNNSFEDYLKLPLNDLYKQTHGDNPNTFDKYTNAPNIINEEEAPPAPKIPQPEKPALNNSLNETSKIEK